MATTQTDDLTKVLEELAYPAEKWQITTCATLNGADVEVRRALHELPARAYESAVDVVATLAELDETGSTSDH